MFQEILSSRNCGEATEILTDFFQTQRSDSVTQESLLRTSMGIHSWPLSLVLLRLLLTYLLHEWTERDYLPIVLTI